MSKFTSLLAVVLFVWLVGCSKKASPTQFESSEIPEATPAPQDEIAIFSPTPTPEPDTSNELADFAVSMYSITSMSLAPPPDNGFIDIVGEGGVGRDGRWEYVKPITLRVAISAPLTFECTEVAKLRQSGRPGYFWMAARAVRFTAYQRKTQTVVINADPFGHIWHCGHGNNGVMDPTTEFFSAPQ